MKIRLAYGGSPFPSPEGSLFSLPEILAPARGILSGCYGGMIKCSSLDGLLTRLMVSISIWLLVYSPAQGFDLPSTPDYLPARRILSG